jgi:hypothetical protein
MRNPLPVRRRSRRRLTLTRGAKIAGGALRRTRSTVALPFLGVAALALVVNRRLRARREGTFDQAVDAPAAADAAPLAAVADPSPANPETDLPVPPNGSDAKDTKASKARTKAAVAEADAPNEGAPGHEPA